MSTPACIVASSSMRYTLGKKPSPNDVAFRAVGQHSTNLPTIPGAPCSRL